MGDSRIMVVGASHVRAIRDAWDAERDPPVEFHNYWDTAGQPGQFVAKVAQSRAGLPPPTHVFIALAGNAHNMISIMQHDRFSIGAKVKGEIPQGQDAPYFIPRDLLNDFLRQKMAKWRPARQKLLEVFNGARFYHVHSPPPVLQVAQAADPNRLTPAQRDTLMLLSTTPSSPELRLAIYRAEAEIALGMFRDRFVGDVPPPTAALEPPGYLRPEFALEGDPTHGNCAYGRLVLDDILTRVRNQMAAA